ncbi:hypothetical protein LCGC14_0605920 [marine sediment metagenome]|uniref:Phage tail tape measure protein domain-containing protein n=1 Tax=marine sediment metagenome TaxID=412755 RepID=A0A0F9R996_9ZZZZ
MATVVFELSGDERKLLASYRKAQAGMDAVEKSAAKGIATTKRAGVAANKLAKDVGRVGERGKQAFGPAAINSLAKFAIGFLGVSKAVQGVTAALREMDQARADAARRAIESRQGLGALAQLAETPREMQGLVDLTERIYAGGGGATLDQAARVAFSLRSAGVQKEAQLFIDLRSSGVISQPDVMARAVKTMISSFGAKEAGTVRQVISKAFAASKFNPAIVEPLLEAAAGGGGFARALGISDEEVLAATALQAEETGTPSGGGTRVTALLRQIGKITEEGTGEASFKDKSLKEIILEIRRVAPTPGKLTDLLGERSESLAAFRGLSLKMEQYDVILTEIKRAQDADTAETKIRLARGIPEVRAAELKEQARAKKELGEMKLGIRRNLAETIQDRVKAEMRKDIEQAESPRAVEMALGVTRAVVRLKRFLKGDEWFLQMAEPKLPKGPLREQVRQSLKLDVPVQQPPPASPQSGAPAERPRTLEQQLSDPSVPRTQEERAAARRRHGMPDTKVLQQRANKLLNQGHTSISPMGGGPGMLGLLSQGLFGAPPAGLPSDELKGWMESAGRIPASTPRVRLEPLSLFNPSLDRLRPPGDEIAEQRKLIEEVRNRVRKPRASTSVTMRGPGGGGVGVVGLPELAKKSRWDEMIESQGVVPALPQRAVRPMPDIAAVKERGRLLHELESPGQRLPQESLQSTGSVMGGPGSGGGVGDAGLQDLVDAIREGNQQRAEANAKLDAANTQRERITQQGRKPALQSIGRDR